MSQGSDIQKPSAKQLTEVFTIRKKTGPYSLIPLEIKCQLMQEFGKVHYYFYFSKFSCLKRKLSQAKKKSIE